MQYLQGLFTLHGNRASPSFTISRFWDLETNLTGPWLFEGCKSSQTDISAITVGRKKENK